MKVISNQTKFSVSRVDYIYCTYTTCDLMCTVCFQALVPYSLFTQTSYNYTTPIHLSEYKTTGQLTSVHFML